MYYPLARKLIFQLDPERAHDLTIEMFKRTGGTLLDRVYRQHVPSNPVDLMGLTFPNPVGLAAGLDKNGECIQAFDAMGFGFVEVGTVTPRAQSGNDKPRIFRVLEADGLINRMGFNNLGIDNLINNVEQSQFKGILGINIGKNFDTPVEKGKDDYLIGMNKAFPHASYIAVNISSPNTPGLRSLQYGEALEDLLKDLTERKDQLTQQYNKHVPLLIKIAPDLSEDEIEQISDSLLKYKLDGVIATNTTLERSMIEGMPHAAEAGGLSGRPLQLKSTEVIRKLDHYLKSEIPIIGVGGIDSAMAAKEKMDAGAKLVQVYSGFIYKGPELIKQISNAV
ncbi:dihydroorotate dehydrogenase (quinone) [Agarivorans sp. Toyoura001]|uniref:quinone-dependent dihydroorotate dehydrogenase n=1 Tax=Agarivorans sp. Toyoura001 TaxID=2283141 RepID=UPI0010EA061E|nr:quinone-dependent dihydroorotate dehydrogenase [Agarivorans sp. Toyoura001]GDY25768.1 dihydroorotate dehydrogenase (quinone) [Agarivorans sp. Toyoura001]